MAMNRIAFLGELVAAGAIEADDLPQVRSLWLHGKNFEPVDYAEVWLTPTPLLDEDSLQLTVLEAYPDRVRVSIPETIPLEFKLGISFLVSNLKSPRCPVILDITADR